MKSVNCRFAGAFSLLFLLRPLLVYAGPTVDPTRTGVSLTVLMDFESPHSEASLTALRHSLNHILNPSGISANIQLKEELPDHPQFGSLVIFKMKGTCSLTPMPIGALSDERGPLAMAYTSDGEVLHFGEVQCDRVRKSVQRVLGSNSSLKNQQSYGSALAVVMAHEVYHMMGNAKEHTHRGIAKSALSAAELLDSRFSLSPSAVAAVRRFR